MKRRIAIWAIVGFVVACCWALYAFKIPMASASPAVWTLAYFTFPITLAAHHFAFSVYSALVANAATYALVGLTIEMLRSQLKQRRLKLGH